MQTMVERFVDAGWDEDRVFAWTDNARMTGDLGEAAEELGEEVDFILGETGASRLVLVTWSTSTLAGRDYIENISGAQGRVSMYVSVGGPHYGSFMWIGCAVLTACQQFRPRSGWLASLSSGSDVPGSPGIVYITDRSAWDVNVNPACSSKLIGADNRWTPTCIGHFAHPNDEAVFEDIAGAIDDAGL